MAEFMFRWIFWPITVLLAGCVVGPAEKPNDPYYAPVLQPTAPAVSSTNGSLYQPGNGLELFSDHKAQRVGDIITVLLQERTVSAKSASVDVSKESDQTTAAGGVVLGMGIDDLSNNFSSEREFAGGADAAQRNNLNGEITVTVVDVWPNGALVVRGEKWITLNRGDEFIRFSGVVRPEDVRQNNTVISTRVANARITYSGSGALADSQSMGWLSRFFNSAYWPF